MRISVRCSNKYCKRRSTKSKAFHKYLNPPKCKHCGSQVYLDRYRTMGYEAARVEESGRLCRCGAPHYPHRKGSHPFCQHWHVYVDSQLDRQLEGILLAKQVPVCYDAIDPPF